MVNRRFGAASVDSSFGSTHGCNRDGKLEDIVLGMAAENGYSDGTSPYFGAVVGRVANRIANATFRLPGKYGEASHTLARNEGSFPGSLHGGQDPLKGASKAQKCEMPACTSCRSCCRII